MKLKPPGDYVTAGLDVKDGDLITILDEGKYETLPQDASRELLSFKVLLANGDEKLLSMNNTSQKELMAAWGMDSSTWVMKRVKVTVVRQRVFDKDKDVIYLHPTEETAPVPTEDVEPPVALPDPVPEDEIPVVE